jgi:glyoxylase-like metal-dependent hydrolase (beta-lactamase superfamily II)
LLDANVLQILEGPQENLLPGISVRISNGHTQGHQMVVINDGTSGVVYCGDVIPTSSHIRSAWVMGYDLNPMLLIEEKTALMQEAVEKNWLLYFEHDPYCDLAQVTAAGSDFACGERFAL